jgi:hypothetical protein
MDLQTSLELEMKKELPFLSTLKTPLDVADALEPLTKRNNPHVHEAFAYMLLKAGKIKEAKSALDRLLQMIESQTKQNSGLAWQLEIARRARELQTKLIANVETARIQLRSWEFETVHNIGLEKFWTNSEPQSG